MSKPNKVKESDLIDRIIKISQLAGHYRTSDELTLFAEFLSEYELFKKKDLAHCLDDVLKLATRHLKYAKVPPGQFLYHVGNLSFFSDFFLYITHVYHMTNKFRTKF